MPARRRSSGQHPHVGGKGGGAGEHRVDQHRRRERLGAAEPVRDRPPDERQAPSHQEQREHQRAGVADVGRRRLDARPRQKLGQRRAEHERVDDAVHAVQHPAEPRGPEADDLLPVQRRACAQGCRAMVRRHSARPEGCADGWQHGRKRPQRLPTACLGRSASGKKRSARLRPRRRAEPQWACGGDVLDGVTAVASCSLVASWSSSASWPMPPTTWPPGRSRHEPPVLGCDLWGAVASALPGDP